MPRVLQKRLAGRREITGRFSWKKILGITFPLIRKKYIRPEKHLSTTFFYPAQSPQTPINTTPQHPRPKFAKNSLSQNPPNPPAFPLFHSFTLSLPLSPSPISLSPVSPVSRLLSPVSRLPAQDSRLKTPDSLVRLKIRQNDRTHTISCKNRPFFPIFRSLNHSRRSFCHSVTSFSRSEKFFLRQKTFFPRPKTFLPQQKSFLTT